MAIFLALLLATGSAPATDAAAGEKPKLRCEWVHWMGSLRPRRVCQPEVNVQRNEKARRAAAQQIRDQNDRDQQLIKEDFGPKPVAGPN